MNNKPYVIIIGTFPQRAVHWKPRPQPCLVTSSSFSSPDHCAQSLHSELLEEEVPLLESSSHFSRHASSLQLFYYFQKLCSHWEISHSKRDGSRLLSLLSVWWHRLRFGRHNFEVDNFGNHIDDDLWVEPLDFSVVIGEQKDPMLQDGGHNGLITEN